MFEMLWRFRKGMQTSLKDGKSLQLTLRNVFDVIGDSIICTHVTNILITVVCLI